jgi:hypothetical protein
MAAVLPIGKFIHFQCAKIWMEHKIREMQRLFTLGSLSMSSNEQDKLLRALRAAFTSLPWSIPNNVSDHDTLLGESITNTSSDVTEEFSHFNASLCSIFGQPEGGLVFPERGQRINDLVEDFEVMMDSVVLGPKPTKHLLNDILQWGNTLIAAANSLQNGTQSISLGPNLVANNCK